MMYIKNPHTQVLVFLKIRYVHLKVTIVIQTVSAEKNNGLANLDNLAYLIIFY